MVVVEAAGGGGGGGGIPAVFSPGTEEARRREA